jgi:hypothetical protein
LVIGQGLLLGKKVLIPWHYRQATQLPKGTLEVGDLQSDEIQVLAVGIRSLGRKVRRVRRHGQSIDYNLFQGLTIHLMFL